MVFLVIVLDSSFLIAFYLAQDSQHKNALKLAEQNIEETALLSETILFETLTVLNYKAGIELAKEAYQELMANKYVRFFHFTELEKDEILNEFFNQKSKLSFADVSVIYLARKSKSKVLAFDDGILNKTKS